MTVPPHRGQRPTASRVEGNRTALPSTGRQVSTSSRSMAAISSMKSPGASVPRSTSFSRCSHSAVSVGDCNCSGSTVMSAVPRGVGRRETVFFALFRSTKPADTSFSRIAARVGGVPMPCLSASSGISSLPAISMAESRESSVWCLGGVVLPDLTWAAATGSVCPSVSPSGPLPASASAVCAYTFQPGDRTDLHLTV